MSLERPAVSGKQPAVQRFIAAFQVLEGIMTLMAPNPESAFFR